MHSCHRFNKGTFLTRLSYELKNDELVSSIVQNSDGTAYFAKISYVKGEWRIFNAKRRNCIKQGFAKNKNVLRQAVRRELIKLGVKFEKEFTKKGYAVTGRR